MIRTLMALLIATTLLTTTACVKKSPRGGNINSTAEAGFKIVVPTMNNTVKQGQVETVTINVTRDNFFKQDIRLTVKSDEGITVSPSSVVLKEGDKPEVQLLLGATKNASLRAHKVEVQGMPVSGKPTWVQFDLKVVAP